MKQRIILSVFFITLSFICLAQQPTKVVTYKNCVGYWNSDIEKYDYQSIKYATITFTIYDEYISVDDASHSIYRVVENIPKKTNVDSEIISAKCLDEKNKNCIFAVMRTDDGTASVAVIYGNYMYVYFIN